MFFGPVTLLIFVPLLACLIVLLLPQSRKNLYKYITLTAVIVQLILSFFILGSFDHSALAGIDKESQYQFVQKYDWIGIGLGSLGKLSINYFVGLDGLSIWMVVLSAIVMIVGVISSWKEERNLKGYFALYLLLSASIVGCFVALDFFLFYLFFELLLLPMYFLIGMWGGPRREYASIKFFLYTLAGSILILLGIIGLYLSVIDPMETAVNLGMVSDASQAGDDFQNRVRELLAAGSIPESKMVHSFNMLDMMHQGNYIPGSVLHPLSDIIILGWPVRLAVFLALFVGFIIKLPSVPFHTWLPDAHVEAPTPISVLLAALLLKVGAYGILRIPFSMIPEGVIHFAWFIGLLGVISIIYGAMNALAMKDIKKLIAYSSVSHMGFVLLGFASVTPEGMNGAVFQMFSHGILSALLFLIAGVLYDRTHDRTIENYRGLASRMPSYTVIVTIAFFASLGLPGFSGFIAELFVLLGAFNSGSVNGLLPKWMAAGAAVGILLGAVYYLWTLQKMFFGKYWTKDLAFWNKLKDADSRELTMMIPLILLTILFGLFPGLFFDYVSLSVNRLVELISSAGIK